MNAAAKSVLTVSILVVSAVAIVTGLTFYLRYLLMKYPEVTLSARPPSHPVDCYPDGQGTKESCTQRGCLWAERGELNRGAPNCFLPDGHGYELLAQPLYNDTGILANLTKKDNVTIVGKESINLQLQVTYLTKDSVRIQFVDSHTVQPVVQAGVDLFNKSYDVVVATQTEVGVVVRRKPNLSLPPNKRRSSLVFDSRNPGLVVSHQLVQVSTRLPSGTVFGLEIPTQNRRALDLQWKSLGLFIRHELTQGSGNLGAHPFYMCIEDDGSASGVYLRNTHALEVFLQPQPAATFRAIGGSLDLYVFLGPTPEDVVKQYHRIAGYPMLPPYWALGFQLGRQKAGNVSHMENLIDRIIENGLPFDVLHLGHDVLDHNLGLTFDPIKFTGLPQTIKKKLHDDGRRVLAFAWGGIDSDPVRTGSQSPYSPLAEATKPDRQMLVSRFGKSFVGKLFNRPVVYPDYSHPKADEYWKEVARSTHAQLAFDGIILDLNAPYSEGIGRCEANNWNQPPFKPASIWINAPLYKSTLCLDANHSKGLHYSEHNLYALRQAESAYKGLLAAFHYRRPLLLSRSHAPGIGSYAGVFLTDNLSFWPDMERSIGAILQLNLFGIPLVGADICGYHGNTSEMLCLRWMQLGAFYPLSRNFNYGDASDQDPPAISQRVLDASKNALYTRYALLPYLYTLFYLASVQGGTVVRPMLHEFPSDNATWFRPSEDQFLWGPALLVSPLLRPRADAKEDAYLPKGNRWFDYYTRREHISSFGSQMIMRREDNVTLHVRGGHIIPYQLFPNVTTHNSNPLGLIVALDDKNTSSGVLYLDDHDNMAYKEHMRTTFLRIYFAEDRLTLEPARAGYDGQGKVFISTVQFWGVSGKPLKVLVNNLVISSSDDLTYDFYSKVLEVRNLRFAITKQGNRIQLQYLTPL